MAATSTVRISESTRRTLKDLSETERVPMQTLVERAIETYRRERFLEAANRTYAALKANPAMDSIVMPSSTSLPKP